MAPVADGSRGFFMLHRAVAVHDRCYGSRWAWLFPGVAAFWRCAPLSAALARPETDACFIVRDATDVLRPRYGSGPDEYWTTLKSQPSPPLNSKPRKMTA
jgi:hypothetical protein